RSFLCKDQIIHSTGILTGNVSTIENSQPRSSVDCSANGQFSATTPYIYDTDHRNVSKHKVEFDHKIYISI
ncbi:hypothetical protein, partial [Paenibacillus albidus]|uniref:hypothetical protein n=1 Tax=Paenibacillus albidus TaxID=2041023 RepID=UPI001E31385D